MSQRVVHLILHTTIAALILVIIGCANLGQMKRDPQAVVPSDAQKDQPLQRSPTDVGTAEQAQMKTELLRLQEENAKLRAQLIELQQKIATSNPKKKEKKEEKEKVVSAPEPQKRKPSKAPQKVASAPKKKEKKQKVIQVSFDEPVSNDPAKN